MTDARTRAIEQHLALVEGIARRFAGSDEPLEDLIQVGTIGLIKAVDRFDPERGVPLGSLAAPAIEGEIRHHLRDRASLLRTPRPVRELAAQVRSAQSRLAAASGRRPTPAELAKAVGASEDAVDEALTALETAVPVPLSEAVEPTSPDGPADARLLLEQGWRSLSERERRILELRFYRDLTQAQIAREVGLSQPAVSRIIRDALARLRTTLDAPEAAAYGEPTKAPPEAPPTERPTHSGRLVVRMPQSLHTELARAAEREGVSLNALITGALAGAVGWRDDDAPEDPLPPASRRRWSAIALAANVAVVVVTLALAIVLFVLAVRV